MEKNRQYFDSLNYSLANEDTRFELEICEQKKPPNILAVCGSGGRFLPLLKSEPRLIVALDLSKEQLCLAALREASLVQLTYNEYMLFWGFPPYGAAGHRIERKKIFERIDLDLDTRECMTLIFKRQEFKGLIYTGKWEKTITIIPFWLKKIFGNYYDAIFEFSELEDQKVFFDKKLRSFFWKLIPRIVLMIFGNAAFFNYMLYRGSFVRKNISESYFDFYRNAFRRCFYNGLTRENFFLQLVFLGEIRYPEAVTVEAVEEVFYACKAALLSGSKIQRQQKDIISYAKETDDKFDFVSLSDVPSYFYGSMERDFMQDLRRCLNLGAIVVVRCYLRVPEGTNLEGYRDVSMKFVEGMAREKTQMYRILVYEYIGS